MANAKQLELARQAIRSLLNGENDPNAFDMLDTLSLSVTDEDDGGISYDLDYTTMNKLLSEELARIENPKLFRSTLVAAHLHALQINVYTNAEFFLAPLLDVLQSLASKAEPADQLSDFDRAGLAYLMCFRSPGRHRIPNLMIAHRLGNAMASVELANAALTSKSKDTVRAIEFLEEGINRGSSQAMYKRAKLYLDTQPRTAENLDKAIALLTESITLENPYAILERGLLYLNSADLGARDIPTAIQLFENAISISTGVADRSICNQFSDAMKALGTEKLAKLLLPTLKNDQPASTQARRYLTSAAGKTALLDEMLKEPRIIRPAFAPSESLEPSEEAPAAPADPSLFAQKREKALLKSQLATLTNALNPKHALGKIFATASGAEAPSAAKVGSHMHRLAEARKTLYLRLHPMARPGDVELESRGPAAPANG